MRPVRRIPTIHLIYAALKELKKILMRDHFTRIFHFAISQESFFDLMIVNVVLGVLTR